MDFRAKGLRFRVYYYLSLALENMNTPRGGKSHGCKRVPRFTSAPSLRLSSSSLTLMGDSVHPSPRARVNAFDFRGSFGLVQHADPGRRVALKVKNPPLTTPTYGLHTHGEGHSCCCGPCRSWGCACGWGCVGGWGCGWQV